MTTEGQQVRDVFYNLITLFCPIRGVKFPNGSVAATGFTGTGRLCLVDAAQAEGGAARRQHTKRKMRWREDEKMATSF